MYTVFPGMSEKSRPELSLQTGPSTNWNPWAISSTVAPLGTGDCAAAREAVRKISQRGLFSSVLQIER